MMTSRSIRPETVSRGSVRALRLSDPLGCRFFVIYLNSLVSHPVRLIHALIVLRFNFMKLIVSHGKAYSGDQQWRN